MGIWQTIGTMFGPARPREVALGFAISIKNTARGLDLFGSPHELLNELRVRGVDAGQIIVELDTAIVACEVFKLLETQPDAVTADHDGAHLPLLCAVCGGAAEAAKLLLAIGGEVDARSQFGMSPLHWSAALGDDAICQVLLDAGADPRKQNWFFATPGELALLNGHIATARLVSRSIASPPDAFTAQVAIERMRSQGS